MSLTRVLALTVEPRIPCQTPLNYETGSIENPEINQRIVDVLEGSQPAFVKRRLKYDIQ